MALVPNIKASQNVSCWLCDHFQRYDRQPEPTKCVGECRLLPPIGEQNGYLPDPTTYYEHWWWPVVQDANYAWCARFQRSREANLPAYPDQCQDDPVIDERTTFWAGPWNKKINSGYVAEPQQGVACWNCDHFNKGTEGPVWENGGQCRANPSFAFMEILLIIDGGYAAGHPAVIPNGVCFWCAQWERTRHPQGDPSSWSCPEPL